jgi:hypothetical protein
MQKVSKQSSFPFEQSAPGNANKLLKRTTKRYK